MKLITHCPTCGNKLVTKQLLCEECGLELGNTFELSAFDYLSAEDMVFLEAFLKARGNLKIVQDVIGISYPTAKSRLEQVIENLGLKENEEVHVDISNLKMEPETKASAIVRNKLIRYGGKAVMPLYNGKPYEMYLCGDGDSFSSWKNSNTPILEFKVFDIVVDLLMREGGKAMKGQGRGKNDKVGSERCNEHTVVGVIAMEYWGKKEGESTFDPVFAIAAILDWADIADNGWGYLKLKESYLRKVKNNEYRE